MKLCLLDLARVAISSLYVVNPPFVQQMEANAPVLQQVEADSLSTSSKQIVGKRDLFSGDRNPCPLYPLDVALAPPHLVVQWHPFSFFWWLPR